MPKLSHNAQLHAGDQLVDSLEALSSAEPHLQPLIRTLKDSLEDMRTAKRSQLALRAAAQQATRDLEAATERAKQASARLHCGLLAIHGTKSAQLLAFGMRPHRVARYAPAVGGSQQLVATTSPGGGTAPPAEVERPAQDAVTDAGGGIVAQPATVESAMREESGKEGATVAPSALEPQRVGAGAIRRAMDASHGGGAIPPPRRFAQWSGAVAEAEGLKPNGHWRPGSSLVEPRLLVVPNGAPV